MSILSYNEEEETTEEISTSLENIGKALQLLAQRLREFNDSYEEFSTTVKENCINDDCNM